MATLYTINDKAAREVLVELRKILKTSKSTKSYELENYNNGREHGFAVAESVKFNGKKVAFSEHRRSDNIVVYQGVSHDFEHNTNIPSEKAYEKAIYFAYNEPRKAAKAIAQYLGV